MARRPVPSISFEFFPPKTDEAAGKLWQAVLALEPLAPSFVSVTYGAGGTTRARTHETVCRIAHETGLKPAAHLTCVGASRAEVDAVAQEYWDAGIRHIVALRGDPPQGSGAYKPHPEGYEYASDLVQGLRRIGAFEISVAAFPEKHPESASFDEDMRALAAKVQAGATRAISQYFFDTDAYLRLRDRVAASGIPVSLVPGIIPISHFGQLKKFSAMCGAVVPGWLEAQFAPLDETPEARDRAAVSLAARQCETLIREGVEHLHFYTLNRADLTQEVCRELSLGAVPA